MKRLLIVGMMFVAVLAGPARAMEPVKIGMITTLSTKAGYLGEEIRDGFQLAIDQENGRLGGVPVELLVDDDGRKPGKAKQIAERFIKRDGVKILTGIVFSNVAIAVVPKVVRQDVIYVSANAGPSLLAGKGCHKNYFNVAYQNDNLDEVVGKYVTDAGFKNVYLLAPNYPAGKDHLGGFKRYYKGSHRRRGLHQAGPVGLCGRDCRPARRQARRGVLFPARGHGHQFSQTIRPGRTESDHPGVRAGFLI
jgi:branched-chain amino acid transport system substrate-binding protein